MRLAIAATALVIAGTLIGKADAAPERRCGWLANPSPANWWLLDREWQPAALHLSPVLVAWLLLLLGRRRRHATKGNPA